MISRNADAVTQSVVHGAICHCLMIIWNGNLANVASSVFARVGVKMNIWNNARAVTNWFVEDAANSMVVTLMIANSAEISIVKVAGMIACLLANTAGIDIVQNAMMLV